MQGSFKGAVFDQHYWNAPPIHRALLTLSEVVVSTGGPLKDGEEPGANKGRTRAPEEWDGQQRQLRKEARALQHPGAAAPRPGGLDGVRRGVSGLFGVGRNAAWWQATALKEYADLRGMQQRLEGQAKVCWPAGVCMRGSLLSCCVDRGVGVYWNSCRALDVGPREPRISGWT